MTAFREHVVELAAHEDCVTVDEHVHWADGVAAVAAEAARTNGPAVRFTDTGGNLDLVGGAYGGPDRLAVRQREPWSRFAAGLGLSGDAGYRPVLDALVDGVGGSAEPTAEPAAADSTNVVDLRALGLPVVDSGDAPTATLGIAVIPGDADAGDISIAEGVADADAGSDVRWTPVRASVHGSDRLRLSLPRAAVEDIAQGTPVTVALGVPLAALVAALAGWRGDPHIGSAIRAAASLDDVPVTGSAAGPVPASSEVLVETAVTGLDGEGPVGSSASWEGTLPTRTVSVTANALAVREDAVVPFSPMGAPMADDRQFVGVVESAHLYRRLNNYWGVTPVEWVALPAEAGLGICLVASEVLYAGFEWQLANALFSFSPLFDKVVVLEDETSPMDLSRAFDDMWVKANPAHDWEFSDPDAPAASAPSYRRNGATGSNLYVDAAWDPRWDEEYIAPRVTFENIYPPELRENVRESWTEMGFEHGPEYEPEDR